VEERDGFARTYGVELLCVERPKIWKPRLLASLRQRCPGVAPLDGKDNSEILSFIHKDHPVQLADGQIPAQTLIAQTDKKPTAGQYKSALEQSWNFPEARDIVERCTAAVLVTDLMSSALPYKERLDLFQRDSSRRSRGRTVRSDSLAADAANSESCSVSRRVTAFRVRPFLCWRSQRSALQHHRK
jgi:hypothetical protein